MITEWLIQVGTGLWAFLAGLFPDWIAPPEMLQAGGMIEQLFGFGQGLEPFADWGLLALLGAIPLTVWVSGITIRSVRLLISHVPFVGGNG